VFIDYQATYRNLLACRNVVRRFLKKYQSYDLFEAAFRHKVKDTIIDFKESIDAGGQGYIAAKTLLVKTSRFMSLMQKVKHGSKVGLRNYINGIRDDLEMERPSIKMIVSDLNRLPPQLTKTELGPFFAFSCHEFVNNALDELGEEGTIKIFLYLKKTDDAIILSVWNDGPSIPADIASSIFEEGCSTKGAGRGMGLSIIQRLSNRFGGTVILDQAKGVRFSLVVPLNSD